MITETEVARLMAIETAAMRLLECAARYGSDAYELANDIETLRKAVQR